MIYKIFLIFVCIASMVACSTTPMGRTQFAAMPKKDIDSMGFQAFNNLKKQKPISTHAMTNQIVRCIAAAITYEIGGDWEIVVFKDDSLNAFALPGNKIGVHTGLVKFLDNQDQLATVIGHEVGHVLSNHSNERISHEFAVNQGLSLIQAIGMPQSALGQSALSLLGIGAQYGLLLPYSRLHESEADLLGLELMAKAGFNPEQSVPLWQKMDQASQGRNPVEFLSTHPAHETRIQDLQEHMPKALEFLRQAKASGKNPLCA